jgi:hypothetical protein
MSNTVKTNIAVLELFSPNFYVHRNTLFNWVGNQTVKYPITEGIGYIGTLPFQANRK